MLDIDERYGSTKAKELGPDLYRGWLRLCDRNGQSESLPEAKAKVGVSVEKATISFRNDRQKRVKRN